MDRKNIMNCVAETHENISKVQTVFFNLISKNQTLNKQSERLILFYHLSYILLSKVFYKNLCSVVGEQNCKSFKVDTDIKHNIARDYWHNVVKLYRLHKKNTRSKLEDTEKGDDKELFGILNQMIMLIQKDSDVKKIYPFTTLGGLQNFIKTEFYQSKTEGIRKFTYIINPGETGFPEAVDLLTSYLHSMISFVVDNQTTDSFAGFFTYEFPNNKLSFINSKDIPQHTYPTDIYSLIRLFYACDEIRETKNIFPTKDECIQAVAYDAQNMNNDSMSKGLSLDKNTGADGLANALDIAKSIIPTMNNVMAGLFDQGEVYSFKMNDSERDFHPLEELDLEIIGTMLRGFSGNRMIVDQHDATSNTMVSMDVDIEDGPMNLKDRVDADEPPTKKQKTSEYPLGSLMNPIIRNRTFKEYMYEMNRYLYDNMHSMIANVVKNKLRHRERVKDAGFLKSPFDD